MTAHTFWYLEALEAVSGVFNDGTPTSLRTALRATVSRLTLPIGLTRDNFGPDEAPFLFGSFDPAFAFSSLWCLGLALGTSVVARGLLGPQYTAAPYPSHLAPGLLVSLFMALAPIVLCNPTTAGVGLSVAAVLTSLAANELSYHTRGHRGDYLINELGPLGHEVSTNLPGSALPSLGWFFPLAR